LKQKTVFGETEQYIQMVNIFFNCFHHLRSIAATNPNLQAPSSGALMHAFDLIDVFQSLSRSFTAKLLASYPTTFSNRRSNVGHGLKAYPFAPAGGQV
jgi:hypothetical protein